MQNYTPPGGWGPILHFLHENRLALQGALTAFFIALLFSLWDGVQTTLKGVYRLISYSFLTLAPHIS